MSRLHSTFKSYLVTPAELDQALQSNSPSKLSTAPKTIPICASWFLPNDPDRRTGIQVFKEAHIRHARFFDLDKVADHSSPYPHMLPDPETFRSAMGRLGVNRDDTLVVYDTQELGIFSAPRVAWTLKVFGHPAVHVLNNFKLWVQQGYPIEAGEPGSFDATEYPLVQPDTSKVISFEQLKDVVRDVGKEGSEPVQIMDARSEGRWTGDDPEPRPGLSSGHMPGSTCVPLPLLLDPKTKAFLPADQLRQKLEQKGINADTPIISTCGSGVMAAALDTAVNEAFGKTGRVYDGSWTEWAQRARPSDNLILKSAGNGS